jgi:hypothetical protein
MTLPKLTPEQQFERMRQNYGVEWPVLLPGDDIETDVMFTVTIQGGEVMDITHAYGVALDSFLSNYREEIEGEAMEQWYTDRADYIECHHERKAEYQRADKY